MKKKRKISDLKFSCILCCDITGNVRDNVYNEKCLQYQIDYGPDFILKLFKIHIVQDGEIDE